MAPGGYLVEYSFLFPHELLNFFTLDLAQKTSAAKRRAAKVDSFCHTKMAQEQWSKESGKIYNNAASPLELEQGSSQQNVR